MGGTDLDISTPPGSGDVADYAFTNHNVIAELKSLEEDTLHSPWGRKLLSARYESWVSRKLVGPIWGEVRIESQNLPEECQRELVQALRRRIQKKLKKANSQIKNTRLRLGMPQARGLLLLEAAGDTTYPPGRIEYFLHHCTRSNTFSSINTIIYFSVNNPVRMPDGSERLFWGSYVLEGADGGERCGVDGVFLKSLKDRWFSTIASVTGTAVAAQLISNDPENVQGVEFTEGM